LADEVKKALLEALCEHELRGKPGEVAKYKALLNILNMLENISDMLKSVLQEENTVRSCFNCKWCVKKGPHLGCYYQGQFKRWLPKEKASHLCVCEISKATIKKDGKEYEVSWAKWEADEKT